MELNINTANYANYYSFLRQITSDPEIATLLDYEKLVLSEKFRQLLDRLIRDYLRNGDVTRLLNLLAMLQLTQYYRPLLLYICHYTLTDFTFRKGKLALVKKPVDSVIKQKTLEQYLRSEVGSLKDVLLKLDIKNGRATSVKKIDMLDSYARLPGSFEGGKRR